MDDAEPARAGRMDRPRRILGIAVVAVVVLVVGNLVLGALRLRPSKAEPGVPDIAASRHTAIIEGYIVEGHLAAIARPLAERPSIDVIALPVMPAGSPGMARERKVHSKAELGMRPVRPSDCGDWHF